MGRGMGGRFKREGMYVYLWLIHVWMWELDCEERWSPKHWCFSTVVLEKTLESPLDCKEIQPVHSKGDQPWDFFGRNDAKAETPVLWPSHAKSWLTGKDSDAGRDSGQEEKGTEDEMAGWHHRLDWVNSGSWWWTGRPGMLQSMESKELDMTEQLKWTELIEDIRNEDPWDSYTFMTVYPVISPAILPTDFIHTKIWEPLKKISLYSWLCLEILSIS